MNPEVSVVVPTYNSGDVLDRCLQALRASDWPDLEIIVVDDASTDDHAAGSARRFDAQLVTLDQNVGAGGARNAGAHLASGNILMMVDADVLVYPDTIRQAVEALDADPHLGAVFGSYDDQPHDPAFLSQYRNLLHHWVHQTGERQATTFWTGCGAVRKKLFIELGGFKTGGNHHIVEDIDLGYRLHDDGWGIALKKDMLCTHLKHWSLGNMVRTDIFMRAIPWLVLLLERPDRGGTLNVNQRARLATLCAGLLLVVPPMAIFWPMLWWLMPILLGVMIATQWGFYRFLLRSRGLGFTLMAVPAQLLFYLCCAVAIPIAYWRHWRGG